MLTIALIVFGVAALGGATLAYLRIVKKDVSMPLAIVHGAAAAAGLVLLILGVMEAGTTGSKTSLAIFLVAALGGFTLFSFHLRSRPMPVPLVLIHGGAAITAFLILLLTVVL
ncbi:MAG TPA: hypothetical protein VIX18_05360 [Nitrospirota bacterium]